MTLVRNETQRHSAALKSAGQNPISLLPLNGCRRLGCDVQNHTVDLGHRVGDARGDTSQHVVRQARPISRHRILRGHGTQHDRVAVGAAITLNAHGANISQQHNRALPDLLIQAGRRELLAGNQVRSAQDIQALTRHLANDANTQARAREGLAVHQVIGQAKLATNRTHLVLEQGAQGLNQLEGHVLGQAAHVVVALNIRRALTAAGLDDVGVQGTLDQELHLATGGADLFDDLLLGGLERANEFATNDLALGFRVGDSGQSGQESLGLVAGDDADAHAARVVVFDLLALARTQQTVIDEKAGELIADSLVNQRRGHGGIHATGECTNHLRVTDLLADLRDLLVNNRVRRPRGFNSRALVEEVLQSILAELRVADLGVPLQAVEVTLSAFESCDRGLCSRCGDGEAFGRALNGVAVAHPHDLTFGSPIEEAGLLRNRGVGVPVLAGSRASHGSAQRVGHGLEAVADSQNRHTRGENRGINGRSALFIHG